MNRAVSTTSCAAVPGVRAIRVESFLSVHGRQPDADFRRPEPHKESAAALRHETGEAIESPLLTRQIESAQRKVEAHNFDIRKNLLEYDDVANDQRHVVYHQRNELMSADEIEESVAAIRAEVVDGIVDSFIPPGSVDELWDAKGLERELASEYGIEVPVTSWLTEDTKLNEEGLRKRVAEQVDAHYVAKVEQIGEPVMRHFEKAIMLQQLDHHWKEHLGAMDYLRQGIHLRGYAQKNPKMEYKREAFEMFGQMLDQVKQETISILSRVRVRSEEEVQQLEAEQRREQKLKFQHANAPAFGAEPAAGPGSGGAEPNAGQPVQGQAAPAAPFVRVQPKVGRNAPCPCGSGKKYKQCHGRLDQS